ncbi:hypothetical protein FACS18949_12720 [Clostridia bacterium]|nr:hypothetical protein FACS18949_12720 [Clostridia bacterium]
MSILAELNTLFNTLLIPVETGVFSGVPPDIYCVLTPLTDTLTLFGDNTPGAEVQEARISLFCNGNYIDLKQRITHALIINSFTITERRYVGHENDTNFHAYTIDVAKYYTIGVD